MLHYNPLHVSSSTMLIFRRTNFIIIACGIVTLCKRPYSMPVESGVRSLSTGVLYMDRVYGTNGGQEKCLQDFSG